MAEDTLVVGYYWDSSALSVWVCQSQLTDSPLASPWVLAAFSLGWYVSDTLTRDEKQKWQRQMENEFNRSIKNQDDAKKTRERRLKKSAFDDLQEYYQGHME